MEKEKQCESRKSDENRKRSRENMENGNVSNDGDVERESGEGRKKVKRDRRMEIPFILNEKDVEVLKEVPMFQCPYCHIMWTNRRYSEIKILRMHISKEHKQVGDYLCWRCNEACESVGHLIDHIRQEHAEEDDFSLRRVKGRISRMRKR